MSGKTRTGVKIGIALMVFGAMCNAVGVGLTVEPRPGHDRGAGIFWLVFSVGALILPGALLVVSGRRQARRAAQIETIVALARASERLSFEQIAAELQVSAAAARKLLLKAISEQRIVGRLDLEHGAFISGSVHAVEQETVKCRNCGATSTAIPSVASKSQCQYCGFSLA